MQNGLQRVDKTFYTASKLEEKGNSDFQYWFDKSVRERLTAAVEMIRVSFREPNFIFKKVDRSVFMCRKQID